VFHVGFGTALHHGVASYLFYLVVPYHSGDVPWECFGTKHCDSAWLARDIQNSGCCPNTRKGEVFFSPSSRDDAGDLNPNTMLLAQALFRATILGAIDGVQQLLAAKVSANCKEEDGDTPLHVAAGLGNEALVKVLLQAKANVETRDNMGNRAEDDAMDGGHSALHTMLHELRGFGPGGRHSPETELDRLQSHVTRRHEELASHLQQQVSHFESMLCFARRAPQPLHRGLSHTFCNVAVVA